MRPPFASAIGLLGNHSPHIGPTSGSGRTSIKTPFYRVTLAAKAGDTRYVHVSDLYSSSSASGVTLYAQTLGGTVVIDQTLAPPELAGDPTYDDSGMWVDPISVPPGSIVKLPSMSTALRIKFSGDATVYLIGA